VKRKLYIQLEEVLADLTKSARVLYSSDDAARALFDFRTHCYASPVCSATVAIQYLVNSDKFDITMLSKVARSSTDQVRLAKAWWLSQFMKDIMKKGDELSAKLVFIDGEMCDVSTEKMIDLDGVFVTSADSTQFFAELYNPLSMSLLVGAIEKAKNTGSEPLNSLNIGFKDWADTLKQLNEV
jgi:hypothetical protein